jgi:hypothetical protein
MTGRREDDDQGTSNSWMTAHGVGKILKNDFRDAEAIADAMLRPTMRFAPAKRVEQLELQALHRVCSRLVRRRTAVVDQFRSFLLERKATEPSADPSRHSRQTRRCPHASHDSHGRGLGAYRGLREEDEMENNHAAASVLYGSPRQFAFLNDAVSLTGATALTRHIRSE